MYRIPLTNSPNQTFTCIVPVNNRNVNLRFRLWYNYAAKYWLFSLYDVKTEKGAADGGQEKVRIKNA